MEKIISTLATLYICDTYPDVQFHNSSSGRVYRTDIHRTLISQPPIQQLTLTLSSFQHLYNIYQLK